MELVQVYFDSSTFDDIERDKKVKFDAQISLVGGTMGLFTGFSIISGVEICYFVTRVLLRSLLSKMREFALRISSRGKEKGKQLQHQNLNVS